MNVKTNSGLLILLLLVSRMISSMEWDNGLVKRLPDK